MARLQAAFRVPVRRSLAIIDADCRPVGTMNWNPEAGREGAGVPSICAEE